MTIVNLNSDGLRTNAVFTDKYGLIELDYLTGKRIFVRLPAWRGVTTLRIFLEGQHSEDLPAWICF